MFSLHNRTALITGAGQGMGFGIARALAQQGAQVIINDFHQDRAETAAAQLRGEGLNAQGIAGDVSSLEAVTSMAGNIRQQWGPIDILVNNAGIPADGMVPTPFREMPVSDWNRYLSLNLYGVLNCTKAVIDAMCETGWGRIVTISSEAWRSANGMGISLYAASKAGAVGFSRQLSSEVGKYGVTVNCIALGMMENVPGVDQVARHFPISRPGRATDAAACAVYLASEEAGWVTGQCIPVNGGVVTA